METSNLSNWNCPFIYSFSLYFTRLLIENQFWITMTACWTHWPDLPLQSQSGFCKVEHWANCWTNGTSGQCRTSMSKMLSCDAVHGSQCLAVISSWPHWWGVDMPVKSSSLPSLAHSKNQVITHLSNISRTRSAATGTMIRIDLPPSVDIQVGVLMSHWLFFCWFSLPVFLPGMWSH